MLPLPRMNPEFIPWFLYEVENFVQAMLRILADDISKEDFHQPSRHLMDARVMPARASVFTVHNGTLACRLRTAKLEALSSSLRTIQSQFCWDGYPFCPKSNIRSDVPDLWYLDPLSSRSKLGTPPRLSLTYREV